MPDTFSKRRIPLRYQAFGQNRHGTLVFLGGSGPGLWLPLIEALKTRYKILVPDFVSSIYQFNELQKDIDIDLLLDASVQLLEETENNRLGIVGWSLGTHIAAALGERLSNRIWGLVLLCGTGGHILEHKNFRRPLTRHFNFENPIPAAANRLAAHLEKTLRLRSLLHKIASPAHLAKRFGLTDPLTEDEPFDAFVREFAASDPMAYGLYTEALSRFDGTSILVNRSFPLLFIAGEKDLFVPPEAVRGAALNANRSEYFEIKSGTHYLPIEYGELLALKIDEFFRHAGRK